MRARAGSRRRRLHPLDRHARPLGGLSETAEAACDVLDAAGFDVVLVETVGVGQAELDVAETADTDSWCSCPSPATACRR